MKKSLKYHKIMSVFKRDIKNNGSFIIGEYSTPEIEHLKDTRFTLTEKVDGTNIRIMYDGKDVIFAGRSDNAQLPYNLIQKLDEYFKTKEQREKLSEIFELKEDEEMSVVLYGEGYGAKIQKGGGNYIKDGVDFVLFDILINGIWLERHNVKDIAEKLGLRVVPVLGKGTINDAIEMCKKGFRSQWGDFIAEGIVARPEVELLTRRGERVIVKVKHKDFLIN